MEKSFLLLKACFVILLFTYCGTDKPPTTNRPASLKEYHPLTPIEKLRHFNSLQKENIKNEDTLKFDKRGWREFKNQGIIKVKLISVSLNDTNYDQSSFTALIGIKADGSNTENLLLPCPPYCPKEGEELITFREIKQEMNQN